MKHKVQISEDRYKQLIELEEYTNAVLCIVCICSSLIKTLFEKHKQYNVAMEISERVAWRKIKDGADSLDNIAFNTGKENYSKFKKAVLMVKFILLNLVARCNDSDMRLWQFYNLLKTFKVVYPGVVPTIEDEQKAFEDLFSGQDKQA